MKLFCIGLHKTGTVSLSKALQRIGFKTRHGYVKHSDMIKKAIKSGLKPLDLLHDNIGLSDEQDTAYLDLYAVRDHFILLDKEYPGSKFILTTRNEDEWVGSVKRQIKKRPDSPYFHHWYYQDELQWRYFKQMHEKCVLAYFNKHERRNDLLIIDITQGEGYWEICRFLDIETIEEPFPHENKS